MTHDELLDTIERHQNEYSPQATDVTAWDALRAVVELHKPWRNGACAGCATDYANANIWTYPCPTIQAIEKELSNG